MGTRIAVAQMDSVMGDIQTNLERVGSFVSVAREQGAQAVLLPELFTTGMFGFFSITGEYGEIESYLRKLAEPIPGRTTEYLAHLAAENGVYIYGSILERRGDKYHIAGVFLSPSEGLIATYRKVHLWDREKDFLSAGTEPVVVETDMGPIGLTICYDLLFPEYIRGLVLMGAQIIFNSSSFGRPRPSAPNEWEVPPWRARAFAVTRAYENTVGVAMSTRFGYEGDALCVGRSCIVSPWGSILASLGEGEGVTTAEIPMERLAEWRKRAHRLEDRKVELYRKMLGY